MSCPRCHEKERNGNNGKILFEFKLKIWILFFSGAPTKEIYFLAIIDVLTHYGVRKQAAKAAKTVKYGANVDGISTCDPEQYGKRFIEFMSKAIE